MRCTLIAAAWLLWAAWAGALAGEGAPLRLYAAARAAKPPTLDGKLDDPCWRRLEVTNRFTCVLTRSGMAEAQTWARLAYDADTLYIALRCDEPRMADATRGHQGGSQAFGESVEVFIDANLDRRTYQQYRVAIGGQTEFRLGYGSPRHGPGWRAAVERGPHAWSVEIAIPMTLAGIRPQPGTQVGLNLCRCRANVAPSELSCWSNTKGGFHAPGRSGILVLGDYATWLRAVAADTVGRLERETQGMLAKYPASTRGLVPQMAQFAALREASQRYAAAAHTEDGTLAVFEIMSHELRRAEALRDRVRLAVIGGEFK